MAFAANELGETPTLHQQARHTEVEYHIKTGRTRGRIHVEQAIGSTCRIRRNDAAAKSQNKVLHHAKTDAVCTVVFDAQVEKDYYYVVGHLDSRMLLLAAIAGVARAAGSL